MSRVMGEEVEKLATVLERVEEFAFVVGLRPNAMVRQEGRTLAIADLRRLMEAAATLERASAEQLRFMELYDAARGDVVQLEAQVEAMRKALERIRAKRDPLAMDVRWAVLDEIHEIVDAALSAPAEESSEQPDGRLVHIAYRRAMGHADAPDGLALYDRLSIKDQAFWAEVASQLASLKGVGA